VSVCQSICHVAQLGFTVQRQLNGSRYSWGPWNMVLHLGSDPPTESGRGEVGEHFAILDPRHISGMAEARELKFCTPREGLPP